MFSGDGMAVSKTCFEILNTVKLTVLHWFDEKRNHYMVRIRYPMNLQILREVADSVDQCFRKQTLTMIPCPVFDQ